MGEVLISVNNVSKKFCKDLRTGLWYGLIDLSQEIFGFNRETNNLRKKEFWAVNSITFEVRRGECLGLIGHNGAGKSTLLKMLNGLINPDIGDIEIYGRVSALIELGAGFNPLLSGRENVYINGAILGFSKKEIDFKLQAIVDFAEISEFLDTPVQYYSSGMKVRLGFAIAAQLEPDVLIIDEVLAVGDVGFRVKCYNSIQKLLPNTAIIFVSHSMPDVARIANRLLVMSKGEQHYLGDNLHMGVNSYYELFSKSSKPLNHFSEGLKIVSSNIEGTFIGESLRSDKPIQLKLRLSGIDAIDAIACCIVFSDMNLRLVAFGQSKVIKLANTTSEFTVLIDFDSIPLSTGSFNIGFEFYHVKIGQEILSTEGLSVLARYENYMTLSILNERSLRQIPVLLEAKFNEFYDVTV